MVAYNGFENNASQSGTLKETGFPAQQAILGTVYITPLMPGGNKAKSCMFV